MGKYNSDGTINKQYVQSKGTRDNIKDMKSTEADSSPGAEAWRNTERHAVKKQNDDRDQRNYEKKEQKKADRRGAQTAEKAGPQDMVAFSRFDDPVAAKKARAKAKLKQEQKTKYYTNKTLIDPKTGR